MEALTIPGVDAGVWQIRHRFDAAAAALADRHYSREKKAASVGGPSFLLVLVSPCERAVWVTQRHSPEVRSARVLADGYHPFTYRCALFRNEGAGLSSELVVAAMNMTENRWGPPEHGWQTYVDAARVASSNPGYCFKQAGWRLDGRRGTKVSLVFP